MRSHFLSDSQNPLIDLNTGGEVTNFFPAPFYAAANHGGSASPSISTPPAILPPLTPTIPAESVEAQAAISGSGSGSGGTGSVVAETTGNGITINLIFDAAAMAAPASFRTGIEQAASILSATITNKITVNINIDYSGTGGGAAAGPDNGLFENYSTVRTDLINNTAAGDTTFNALPNSSTIQGQSSVAVWNAQLKLFGLLGANDTTTDDGSATFATDIQSSLLVGVALHELTHALGRVPYGPQPDIFDFFRFTSSGTRLFTDSIPSTAAYFSVNGGTTKIADFGQTSDPSDFLNSGIQGGNDPFNEFYGSSTLQSLTAADKVQLDALGFNTIINAMGIAATATASEAIQGGAAVTLLSGPPTIADPASATLAGATIKIANPAGSAVAGDQLFVKGLQNGPVGSTGVSASWNASTGTLTLTGSASIAVYDTLLAEISYQDAGSDTSSGSHPLRTVTWTVTDGTNTYNTTSQITIDRVPVANNDVAADAVGSTVTTTATSGLLSNDSDLDGDRLTVSGISDAAHGAGSVGASLAGVYGHLTLNADGSYSYVADNSSAVNSAPTGSHLQDTFTYAVGDGNGATAAGTLTITLDRPAVVTAANVVLSAGQASIAASSLFSASDPDGDAIAKYGFMDTGSGHFVLNGVVQANNQEIDVTAAQLSQLTYQSVAGSVDTLEVRANDGTLWSSWTSFTVTPPPIVIEAAGSTSLVEVGSNYFLNPVAGGTGVELERNGTPFVAGQASSWVPIGAEAITGGYEVAWKYTGADQYTVWKTDANGNYVSDLVGVVSGTSTALESIEPSFHQDLNGDGVIGVPSTSSAPPPPVSGTVIESFGSTSLVEVGSNYFLNPVAGGTGVELERNGTPFVAGQASSWVPIGAEAITGGYEVAWKYTGADQYTVWKTDANGNYVSDLVGVVSGTSTALESIEPSFHQDLNGDGVIGVPSTSSAPPPPVSGTVIESFGSTSLVEVGSNYFLNPVAGGTGVELERNGTPFVAGQASSWVPIGAEAITGGYEVAWKYTGADQYTVWKTDANGNYVSDLVGVVSGTSTALESIEPSFHQDLNGDGVIGVPTTTIPAPSTNAGNSNPVSQFAHTAASADGFVFNTAVPSGEASDTIAPDAPGNVLTTLFGQSQSEHWQALFHLISGGDHIAFDHESINLSNAQIAHLLDHFIIH